MNYVTKQSEVGFLCVIGGFWVNLTENLMRNPKNVELQM